MFSPVEPEHSGARRCRVWHCLVKVKHDLVQLSLVKIRHCWLRLVGLSCSILPRNVRVGFRHVGYCGVIGKRSRARQR